MKNFLNSVETGQGLFWKGCRLGKNSTKSYVKSGLYSMKFAALTMLYAAVLGGGYLATTTTLDLDNTYQLGFDSSEVVLKGVSEDSVEVTENGVDTKYFKAGDNWLDSKMVEVDSEMVNFLERCLVYDKMSENVEDLPRPVMEETKWPPTIRFVSAPVEETEVL